MNLSNEDNTLQLFKYIPDVTSQLLIQANDSQELVQVPNICDDLLLNGLDSNSGWTLGGLPVLLNAPLLTTDQQSTLFLNSLPAPVDEPGDLETDNILQLNDGIINPPDFNQEDIKDNEILLKAPTRIITEDGLFTSESLGPTIDNTNLVARIQASLEDNIGAQSADIASEFIDINGMLIRESTLVNLSNNRMLLNVQADKPNPVSKKRPRKRNLPLKLVKSKKNKSNIHSLNLDITSLGSPPILPSGLLEICNEGNIRSLVNVNSVLNNSLLLTTEPILETCDDGNENINSEPDSTVANDAEYINIDDLATVVTNYQCKKCQFSCNDQHRFIEHFKEQHTAKIKKEFIPLNDPPVKQQSLLKPNLFSKVVKTAPVELLDEPLATVPVLYNEQIVPDLPQDDIHLKKIMRVKRKPAKKKLKIYEPDNVQYQKIILRSPENDVIFKEEPAFEEPELEYPEIEKENEDEEDGDEIRIYLCSECASHFDTVEDCRNHMIQVHNLQSLDEKDTKLEEEPLEPVEPTEEMKKRNRNAINKFLTTDVIKSRKNKCTIKGCQYRFAKPELLERHVKCHVTDVKNQFKCPECEEIYPTWRVCSLHLWNCHQLDLDLYSCPLCDYRGQTPIKLTNHLKIHSEDREYTCPDCGKCFKQASQMRNHRVIHLDRKLQDIPKWYAQKHCDKCGKDFADAKCLKKHIQAVHSKLKPFICNVCGHSCARKAMLQMHLRQHTGEKPYACKLCYYKTGDHNSLRRHMMRHSGERPYKCPHCSYQAIQSNSYKNHLANKHPGKGGAYNCTYCSFKSVKEESYVGHINDHKRGLIDANGKRRDQTVIVNNVNGAVIFENMDSSSNSNNNVICDLQNTPIITQGKIGHRVETEDEETQHCFLTLGDLSEEQTVDTGGITIPADP